MNSGNNIKTNVTEWTLRYNIDWIANYHKNF